MVNFKNWISKFRVPKGSYYSHLGMGEFIGRYFIPTEKIPIFTKNYFSHVFDKNLECNLIERHENLSCLLFDLDFKLEENSSERGYDIEQIRQFIRIVCGLLSTYIDAPLQSFDAFVFEKANTSKKQNFVKDGVHIVFPFIVTELAVQYFFREEIILETKELLENDLTPIEDIIDISIIEKNGWMMYGSKKPDSNSTYKLTGIWTQNSINEMGHLLPNRLINSPYYEASIDLLKLLSIRNFTIADVVQFKEESIDIIDHFIEGFNENRKKNNEIIKKISTIDCQDIDVNKVSSLVDILSNKRAESYQNWIEVGWCLHNIDPNLLNKWIEFSEKSDKYKDEASVNCEKYWSKMNNSGLGLGTLHMWAKKDNQEAYYEILRHDEEYYIYQTIKEAIYSNKINDLAIVYDINIILKMKFGHKFVCSSFDNKTWFEFNGNRWVEGDKDVSLRKVVREDLYQRFKKVSKKYKELSKNVDPSHPCKDKYFKTSHEISKVADKFRNQKFRDQIMKEATEHLYWDSSRSRCSNSNSSKFEEMLDNATNLVGMRNGTYDLNLGIFRESRSEDYISLTTDIDYLEYSWTDPIIDEIRRFLDQILPCYEVREYVLRVLASFLDGDTVHEHFHVWVGSGGNGKSKLIELFEKSFGLYCAKLSVAALTQKRAGSSAPTPEIARLKGKRFVVLQEPNEHETLQVGIMKEMTGGDKIIARSLNKEPIEFKPQFKMILTCNQLPKLPADDGGTWRRIKLVEFTSSFKDNPNPECKNEFPLDPHLSEKLNNWKEGFFWILTQYYSIYKNNGYSEPETVQAYTKQYQESVDLYADFIKEKVEKKSNAFLLVDDMYIEFKDWYSRTISPKVPSNKGIKTYMEKKYGRMIYKDHKKGWSGINLRSQTKNTDCNLLFDDETTSNEVVLSVP